MAEFIGGKEVNWFSERVVLIPYDKTLTIQTYLQKSKAYVIETELKFNTSWDWLMPVCKKILNLSYTEIEELQEDLKDSILSVDIKNSYSICLKILDHYVE